MAIYKRGREFELGTTEHRSSKWPERDTNPGPADCEFDALTTRPRCLPMLHPSSISLTLLLRHYELTNENVSYFLTNQSKTKTFIDLKVTRKPKPNKNSTRPYLNEIPVHFTHEIKTKGYDVIGVNVFLRKLMKFLRKNPE